jgi:hypothetical protein
LQKTLKKNFQNICKNKTSGASMIQNVKIRRNFALIYLLWFVLASITKKGEIEREIGLHLFGNDFGG